MGLDFSSPCCRGYLLTFCPSSNPMLAPPRGFNTGCNGMQPQTTETTYCVRERTPMSAAQGLPVREFQPSMMMYCLCIICLSVLSTTKLTNSPILQPPLLHPLLRIPPKPQ